jgi:opacity protein-like surface antigen
MRKYLPALLLLVLVISIPSEALAQRSSTNKVEFTPFVGYRFSNTLTAEVQVAPGVSVFEDVKLTSGVSYGFIIGFPVSDYITIEGQYSYRSSDIQVKGVQPKHVVGTGTASYIHGGAAFTLNPYSRGAKWFLSLNAGVGIFGADVPDMNVDNQSKFSFGFSVGAKIPLSDSIKLRTEFRGYSTRTDLTSLGWICGWYTCGVVQTNQYLWEGEARLGVEFGF